MWGQTQTQQIVGRAFLSLRYCCRFDILRPWASSPLCILTLTPLRPEGPSHDTVATSVPELSSHEELNISPWTETCLRRHSFAPQLDQASTPLSPKGTHVLSKLLGQ